MLVFLLCYQQVFAQKYSELRKAAQNKENAGQYYEAFDMYRQSMLCSDAPKKNDAEMHARACYRLFREQEKKTDKKTVYDYFLKISSSRGVAIRNNLYYMTDTSCNIIFNTPFDNLTYVGYNIFVFQQKELFGLINNDGKVLVQPEYAYMQLYNNGTFRMYQSDVKLKNGENADIWYEYNIITEEFHNLHIAKTRWKYGLINSDKEYVIAPQYSYLEWAGVHQLLIADKDGECSLIDTTGKVLFSATGEIEPFNDHFFRYTNIDKKKNLTVGLLSRDGAVIIPAKYKSVFNPKEGMFKVQYLDKKYGFIDGYGNVIAKCYDEVSDFSGGIAKVKKNGKCGLIDNKGRKVCPLKFEDLTRFSDSLYIAKNGKYGLCDRKGNTILPTEYQRIDTLRNGYAVFEQDGKYGYLNKRGQITLPAEYSDASPFCQGLAAVKHNGSWIYINPDGTQAFEGKFRKAGCFYSDIAIVKSSKGYGVIDYNGNFRIDAKYSDIDLFEDSLIVATDSTGSSKCFDYMGKEKIHILIDNKPFHEEMQSQLKQDLLNETFIAGYLMDTLFLLGNHLVTYNEFVNTVVDEMTTWTDSVTFYSVLQYVACEEHNRVRLIFSELSRQSSEVSLDNWISGYLGYKEFDDYPLNLIINNNLIQAAQKHSVNMSNLNFFSHKDPQGRHHSSRIEETGHQCKRSGENIEKGKLTIREAIEGWVESPGHFANMKSSRYWRFGFGYYNGYFTCVFSD